MDGEKPAAGDDRHIKIEIAQSTLKDLVDALRSLNKENDDEATRVHQNALEDLVSVNSLFTIAVFVGLAFTSPHQHSLETQAKCDADPSLSRSLIMSEVLSFACFLFSSLVAKSLRVILNIRNRRRKIASMLDNLLLKRLILSRYWRRLLLISSVTASLAGIVLLTLSMCIVIQIRVGKLSCGSNDAFKSIVPLVVIVFVSMLLYAPSMVYAVFATAMDC